MPTTGYEFLPHTTDAYVQVRGSSLENALEYAGRALFDTMCDVRSVSPLITENVEFKGDDEIVLLYDWLETLLLKFELENKVYSGFHVDRISRRACSLCSAAMIAGEGYDRRKHGSKVEVKAVTYHAMEVLRENATTVLRFILDL